MKSLLKDGIKEIKVRYKIFLSILFMAFLGVGFFTGIKVTSKDMENTMNSYFQELNVFDLKILKTNGITEQDLEKLKEVKGIKEVYGSFSTDLRTKYEEKEPIAKIMTLEDNINKLDLKEGRFPINKNECVIDHLYMQSEKIKIGDKITLNDENNLFIEKELTVVGVISSPLYISIDRGTTTLGSGKIDYYLSLLEDNLSFPIYTEAYLTIDDSNSIFSEEYQNNVDEVKEKIETLYDDINSTYVLDLNTNVGFAEFKQDTQRIENVAKVFPIIFFLVATLVSLTSMTRMVEEQRVQIGTLKSLGYTRFQISLKYILYASIATIIGGTIGVLVGMNLLPRIIYILYEMMYTSKDLEISYDKYYIILGVGLAYLCIVGATIYSCLKELANNPAELMRPKAPEIGKRVLLEHIPFIWNKFKFTQKVTFRNLFRYKKRFLMTIIGIAGCTSLIVAGFGLKESVSGLLPLQYERIFQYDMSITYNSINLDEKIKELDKKQNIEKVMKLKTESGTIEYQEQENGELQILVVDKEEIKDFIKLIDINDDKEVTLNKKGIFITEKLAILLGIKENDRVILKTSEDKEKEVVVTKIVENYLMHYVYIEEELYNELYGDISYNTIYVQEKDITEAEENILAEEILSDNEAIKVVQTKITARMMDDTMQNLNYVVWILIISAGILAFAVLYNLSNVNISERKRELATIKVLGFYDREVHSYISRENTILTILGIALGLWLGFYINQMIIKTCELDMFLFPTDVSIECYIYGIVITTIFTVIISVINYFTLKKIDMIESLKSVE